MKSVTFNRPFFILPAILAIAALWSFSRESLSQTRVDGAATTDKQTQDQPQRWRGPQPPEGRDWPLEGHFYRRFWFQMGEEFLNPPTNNRFRVNDPYVATHPRFHDRKEPKGNGMMLIPMHESLLDVDAARVYVELWGGHPHTSGRRFTINGRTTYSISVPSEEQCTHAYRFMPVKITDLVQGQNAVQFAVDGDNTFWGHFIVEEAAIDVLLRKTDRELTGTESLSASPVQVVAEAHVDAFELSLPVVSQVASRIQAVHYYASYDGFDENGDGHGHDWHGMTKRKEPLGHLGTVMKAPYRLRWDTSMIRAQTDVEVRASVEFLPSVENANQELAARQKHPRFWKSQSLVFQTAALGGLSIAHPGGVHVAYANARNLSKPFWSRAERKRTCELDVATSLGKIERAELHVTVWDGGAGNVKDYFTLNGHALAVAANGAHDVLYTRNEIDPTWLVQGANRIQLLSDTEHHGIEGLYPGPMLAIRYHND